MKTSTTMIERAFLLVFLLLTPALSLAIPAFVSLPPEAVPLILVFIPAILAILLTALAEGKGRNLKCLSRRPPPSKMPLLPVETVRAFILPTTWLWPVLLWSASGSRGIRYNTHPLVLSSAAPLRRQLPAAWLAGFLVTALTGSAAAIRLFSAGDIQSIVAWFSGTLFFPSLALAPGVWSDSSRLFEVLYVSVWYLVINGVTAVDCHVQTAMTTLVFPPVVPGFDGALIFGPHPPNTRRKIEIERKITCPV